MSIGLPKSLQGRLIALLLLALAGAQAISFLIFAHERNRIFQTVVLEHVQSRIVGVVRLLETAPQPLHQDILRSESSRHLRFRLNSSNTLAKIPDTRQARQLADALRAELGEAVLDIRAYHGIRTIPKTQGRRHPYLGVALQLPDGRWLNAVKAVRDPAPYWARSSLISLGITALLLILVVVLASRRITRPLRRLSAAAGKLGRGEPLPDLPEQGPEDIRQTTRAFNQMRSRVERYITDRTNMLAAISHDLRTPITALRLRAEYIEDPENRERVVDLLDEMEQMTNATLNFAREQARPETLKATELNALLDALCEGYRELGKPVRLRQAPRVVCQCQPLALKRALRNLIDNAVLYGEHAEIELLTTEHQIFVQVHDRGPGIPEQDRQRAFDPFVRLESSRSSETGGIGLGLAIARTVARAHGGDVQLLPREGGGTTALLSLAVDPSWSPSSKHQTKTV